MPGNRQKLTSLKAEESEPNLFSRLVYGGQAERL
jgi:hypothetical protein